MMKLINLNFELKGIIFIKVVIKQLYKESDIIIKKAKEKIYSSDDEYLIQKYKKECEEAVNERYIAAKQLLDIYFDKDNDFYREYEPDTLFKLIILPKN